MTSVIDPSNVITKDAYVLFYSLRKDPEDVTVQSAQVPVMMRAPKYRPPFVLSDSESTEEFFEVGSAQVRRALQKLKAQKKPKSRSVSQSVC